MTGPGPREGEGRDVDQEFARMLEGEGMVLRPGEAPREPAAHDEEPLRFHPDTPADPPTPEDRARARAAHPSAGPPPRVGGDDDEDIDLLVDDFVPPDPDLPAASARTLWSWTALIGGVLVLLVVAVSPSLPTWLGALGGLAALGGLVALLLRAPTRREDDGVEV